MAVILNFGCPRELPGKLEKKKLTLTQILIYFVWDVAQGIGILNSSSSGSIVLSRLRTTA